jgi:hypothetical protein
LLIIVAVGIAVAVSIPLITAAFGVNKLREWWGIAVDLIGWRRGEKSADEENREAHGSLLRRA